MMNLDQLLLYEKTHELFEREDDGFKYWPYLRFEIFMMIQNKKNNTGIAHTKPNSSSKLKGVFKIPSQYLNFRHMKKKTSKKLVYLFLNHQRRVKEDEVYSCLYTDNIINHLENDNYLIVEEPYEGQHYKPVPNKNIVYVDYLDYYYKVQRMLYNLKKTQIINVQTKNDLRIIVDDLSRMFNVKLDLSVIIATVSNMKIKYTILYKYYKKLLREIDPKIVVEVVSYNFSRMVVNEICKELRIPTIELQHGNMGKYHIAYNYNDKMDLPTFPDYIFTFGQFWKDNTRLPIDDDKVKVIGWPFFEDKVNVFKKRRISRTDSKQIILFISQGTIGKELSKLAYDISAIIDENKYHIIYKLHPGEYARWKNEYPWLLDAYLEVIDDNNKDMHYYFAKSDIQVGVYSTALFEGLAYGLKTYIFKLHGHQYMEELYDNNLALLVGEPSHLIEDLDNIKKNNVKFDKNYFWQKEALDQMLTEINNIIEAKG